MFCGDSAFNFATDSLLCPVWEDRSSGPTMDIDMFLTLADSIVRSSDDMDQTEDGTTKLEDFRLPMGGPLCGPGLMSDDEEECVYSGSDSFSFSGDQFEEQFSEFSGPSPGVFGLRKNYWECDQNHPKGAPESPIAVSAPLTPHPTFLLPPQPEALPSGSVLIGPTTSQPDAYPWRVPPFHPQPQEATTEPTVAKEAPQEHVEPQFPSAGRGGGEEASCKSQDLDPVSKSQDLDHDTSTEIISEEDYEDYENDNDHDHDHDHDNEQDLSNLTPDFIKLKASKSPIIDALVFCALKGWGIKLLCDKGQEIKFHVTDVDKYYECSSKICAKQRPTEDPSSRIKALKRWFPDFPSKRERTSDSFIISVTKGSRKDNKPLKLHKIIEKNRRLLGIRKMRRQM